ncbi:putative ABC transporter ATP-binding protein YheS [bacterium BMS3Abin04]|nr:putative ABC transporter ATP-binding protein YheS [bacterium BMS3Abin04]
MIDIQNLTFDIGERVLFENVNLKINPQDKIALVGLNGTGKSTFFKLIVGLTHPALGSVNKPKSIKIGYLPQEFSELKGKTLLNEIQSSLLEYNELNTLEKQLSDELANDNADENRKLKLIVKLGEVHHRMEEIEFYSTESKIKKVLTGLGFKKEDFERKVEEFSGGWQMRIELAKILLNENNLILLDEPTNHLDIDSLRWLIEYFKQYKGALIIVSHDKFFISEVTDKTMEVWNNNISFYNGPYEKYIDYKKQIEEQKLAESQNQQKKIQETEKFIERFRYKASKARQVQSRIKQLEKLDKTLIVDNDKKITLNFPEPERSGAIPVKLKNISAGYGDKVVFSNLDFSIERGEKLALIGPNGTGKSTLAKIIAGTIEPFSGEVIYGHNTTVSYYAQEVSETFNLNDNIITTLSGFSKDLNFNQLRTILGAFLFTNDDVFKKIRVLSGGEKSRVALASILLQKANLVVLDEPTNHLDIQSKEILQNALINFKGTLLLVSHDVDFLKPIANKILEFRNNKIQYYYGNIEYYLRKKEEEKGQISGIKLSLNQEVDDKKVQKRLEAELRTNRYRATKELKKQIEDHEQIIEELESSVRRLEKDLADEKIYSSPILAKEKTQEYNQTKKKLESILEKWTELHNELEDIENQFRSETAND